ncbi:IclR family transcriptional regulator [Terrabacter terrigena]|uniref:IclR family transcriptional regulator n=1 Tax=Terrabacter terrigena TaxID=574718 RepID=A0ABW3MVW2_9MICO
MTQSLDRALLLLAELGDGPKRLGPLADKFGIHKSTALRLLQTLEKHGFVQRRGDPPEFTLGLRLVELSQTLLEELDIRQVARAQLMRLGAETGETIHLALRDGAQVVYLDKVESIHPVRMYSQVGARADAYCTGVGKVLLAYTDPASWPQMDMRRFTDNTITSREEMLQAAKEIRQEGWGWDEREHEDSIRCIAAPVFGPGGAVAAAVSISVPTSRLSAEQLARHVPLLLDATREISRALGGRSVEPDRDAV